MPKVSKTTSSRTEDIGIGTLSQDFIAGHEVAFLSFREAGDLGPMLKGLPDDLCSCPHWGYVSAGRITFTHRDGSTESFVAGDVFHVDPGHSPVTDPGTDVLLISPEDDAAVVNAVIEANMAAMQGAH